jgi:hypothetical protein
MHRYTPTRSLNSTHTSWSFSLPSVAPQHFGPLFLMSPVFPGVSRTFGTVGFLAMHAGFSLSFRLGQFAWISVIAPLAMTPTWFWDGLFYTLDVPRVTLFYNPQSRFTAVLAHGCSTFLLPLAKVVPCTVHSQAAASSSSNPVGRTVLPSLCLIRGLGL